MAIYLTVSGLIFGWAFTPPAKSGEYLAPPIAILTFIFSSIIWLHNRVIQRLTAFMEKCERCARRSIRASGEGKINLFYFHDGERAFIGSTAINAYTNVG
jgi:hypothetical protein